MPSVVFKPDRPSLYPDVSTLSYAFRDRRSSIANALRRISEQGNLLLSAIHLLELGRGGKEMAAVGPELDALNVVWLLPTTDLELHEMTTSLRQFAQAPAMRRRPAMPTAGSFIGAFGAVNVETMNGLLRSATVTGYLDSAIGDSDVASTVERLGRESVAANRQLFRDQKLIDRDIANGATKKQVDDRFEARQRAWMETLVREAHSRVLGDPDYVVRSGGLFHPPSLEQVLSSVPRLQDFPALFPYAFVTVTAHQRARERAGKKASISSKSFQKFSGDFADWAHLVGAAYADGFCCDAATAKLIEGARPRLGFSEPIVLKSDFEALAASLERVLDESPGTR